LLTGLMLPTRKMICDRHCPARSQQSAFGIVTTY
jgi:hypothetical protein